MIHEYIAHIDGPQSYQVGRKRVLCKGGGGGSSTTVQEIPKELKPLARRYTTEATNLFDTPYQAYTGDRNADLNATQLAGLDMTAQRALGGDQLINAGYGNVMDTMSGKYMDPNTNPYLKQNTQMAMDQAMGSINAQFNRPGAFGGTAHQGVAANQLGNIAAQMYGQNYAQERANQLQAWNAAPTYGNMAYQDASQLMGAGQVLQDEAQKDLDWQLQQFQEQQDYPYKNLAAAAGVFGTNLGGTSVTKQSGGGK